MTALPPPAVPPEPKRDGLERVGDQLRKVPVWAWVVLGLVVVGVASLVMQGGDDTNDTVRPSEAFCNDLDDGASAFQLIGDADPQRFADQAYGFMATSCPEHLERHRGYFEQWGINIDA